MGQVVADVTTARHRLEKQQEAAERELEARRAAERRLAERRAAIEKALADQRRLLSGLEAAQRQQIEAARAAGPAPARATRDRTAAPAAPAAPAAGVSLPRTSRDQYAQGRKVARADVQPGDLLFFGSPIGHVGVYVGDGMMINSPQSGGNVRVQTAFRSDFVGAVRP